MNTRVSQFALTLALLMLACRHPAAAEPRISLTYQTGDIARGVFRNATTGLPNDADHIHIQSLSPGGSPSASMAATIHAMGSSFKYDPCFGTGRYATLYQMTEAEVASAARKWRDLAIAAGADYIGVDEMGGSGATNSAKRQTLGWVLKYLNEADSKGKRLECVFYIAHSALAVSLWTDPAHDFWHTVNATCRLVALEHYHNHAYIAGNSVSTLSAHFTAFPSWLAADGDPDMAEIARRKVVLLHSSSFRPGVDGWNGGNADRDTARTMQQDLSRLAYITRRYSNPWNIGFAPVDDRRTSVPVYSHIAALVRWHYGQGGAAEEVLPYERLEGIPGHPRGK